MNEKKLGFGLMRLPKKDGVIDVAQVREMVDLFMEAGFNYFDTAWMYQGSEEAIREALVERYPRDSYVIATKNAAWSGCQSKEEAQEQFYTSLSRLGLSYVNYYLLHNLGEQRTQVFEDFEMYDFVQKMKEEGKIRHVGFSFHSDAEELEEIMQAHPEMEFVQLQINYADWEAPRVQAGACYEVARKYGKPIMVMEPVKGGLLADPPETVASILREAAPEASMASWANRFAAGLPGVKVVLSGMSDVAQMKDNISYMKDFCPLDDRETEALRRAREALDALPIIPCTTCRYCLKVCPKNIGIPGTISALNMESLYGDHEFAAAQAVIRVRVPGCELPTECIECGACEAACPQHLPIIDLLHQAVEQFHVKKVV